MACTIHMYLETKTEGSDEWKYNGEYIYNLRECDFQVWPRSCECEWMTWGTLVDCMQVMANPTTICRSLSSPVFLHMNVELEKDMTNPAGLYGDIFVASYDAVVTASRLLNHVGFDGTFAEKELGKVLEDFYEFMLHRIEWEYDDEHRVVFVFSA